MTTSRLAQARDAVRPALKARLMISGPTGAGKTWTALKIAEVLAEGGKILVIDTEKESALTYADNFTFVHLPWLPPFEPRELARTMAEAGHEYAVVIVDSTSHFWRKEGGTLDIAGGKFTGWKDARPAQEDLVQALLDCHAHVILCTRSKMEHVQEEVNGRHVVRKVGMAPQQDDDLEYELNISIEMDMDHRATVAKSRADAVQVGRSFTAGHEVELAALYADWLKGGEPPAAQLVVDELVARMNALPPAERVACKTEFVEAFGRPDGLRESRVPEAEGLVARFEGRGGGGGDEPEGSAAAPPPPDSQDDGGTSAEVPSAGSQDVAVGAPPSSATSAPGGETEPSEPAAAEEPVDGQEQAAPSGPAPAGGVTVEQLLNASPATLPARQQLLVMRSARQVAGALSIPCPASPADVAADPVLAAAVLHDLAGGDGPPSSLPASTTPWKTQDEAEWAKWKNRCMAKAGPGTKAKPHPRLLDEDKEVFDEQRHHLAWQASHKHRPGFEVESWNDVTEVEARAIEQALELIKAGEALLTFDEGGRWVCQRTAAVA